MKQHSIAFTETLRHGQIPVTWLWMLPVKKAIKADTIRLLQSSSYIPRAEKRKTWRVKGRAEEQAER